MKIKKPKGEVTTRYGKGIEISLTGEEVARAISTYLVAHGITVSGPRTIRVNGELCEEGEVYVDPIGFVIDKKGRKIDGRTGEKI